MNNNNDDDRSGLMTNVTTQYQVLRTSNWKHSEHTLANPELVSTVDTESAAWENYDEVSAFNPEQTYVVERYTATRKRLERPVVWEKDKNYERPTGSVWRCAHVFPNGAAVLVKDAEDGGSLQRVGKDNRKNYKAV